MKRIVLLSILLGFAAILTAQELTPVPNSGKRPFLNNDLLPRMELPTESSEFNNYARKNLPASVLKDDVLMGKIKEIWTKEQKEWLNLNNQIAEKKARLNTLETAEKTDIKAINKVIDEITDLQNKLMKLKAASKQGIRSLLSDNDRLEYDLQQSQPDKLQLNYRTTPPRLNYDFRQPSNDGKFEFIFVK